MPAPRPITLALLFAVATVELGAPAAGPGRVIVVQRPGAEGCPDTDGLRGMVARRPDRDEGPKADGPVVRVRFSPRTRGPGFVAEIALVGVDEAPLGSRRLASSEATCDALAKAAALAVGIALESASTARPPEAPPSAPDAAAGERPVPAADLEVPVDEPDLLADAPEAPASFPPPAPPRARLEPSVAVGAAASFGPAPSPTSGVSVTFGLRGGALSLDVELEADLPGRLSLPGDRSLFLTRYVAGLVPCVHLGPMGLCGLLQGGALQPRGDTLDPAAGGPLAWAAAGGGLLLALGTGPLNLELRVDVAASLARVAARDAATGERYWTTPATALAAGLRLRYRL